MSRHAARNVLVLLALAAQGGCGEDAPDEPPVAEDGAPEGRWRVARTDDLEREIRDLQGIGYVSGSRPAPGRYGVTVHDPARACAGSNLYTSGHAPTAILMDMDGRVLHRWQCSFEQALPDFPPPDDLEKSHFRRYWRRCRLFENGDLLAVFEGHAMVKLNRDSEILWTFAGAPHHDFEVAESGEIFALTRTAHVVPRINPRRPVLEDGVSVLDAEGRETRRVSILACFENSGFRATLAQMDQAGDLLHTNTLEILDGSLADKVPAFARGNLLISCLKTSTIAVLDLERETIVWAAQGSWLRQHQPTVLPGGRLMLFDNLGNRSPHGKSRVMEIDPVTLDPVWIYEGTAGRSFQTDTCGSCQRLPNGNTLITESDNGRAFEVLADGTIVWEFLSPHRAGQKDELIATLFEVIRLPPDFPLGWIE
ncbi:MAG: hypothetical protein HY812_22410 [Planctomycetes bacterium]|nr:hypothetical protein [Planctomycetota bacterium]